MNFLRKFLKSDAAVAVAEYGVMIALVVLLSVAFIQYIGATSNTSFSRVATSIAPRP